MASNFYWRAGGTTYSVPLSVTKITTPSLCVDDNGTIKYVSLAPGAGPANNFHIYYNGVQYYATTGVSPNNWTTATTQWAGGGGLLAVNTGRAATDGNGKVIVVGSECTHSLFPADYDAQTLVSTDGGVTWSHSQIGAGWTLSNHGSIGAMNIATNKAGTWIITGSLSYTALGESPPGHGGFEGVYSVSTNNGASWSQVALMSGWDCPSSTDYAARPLDIQYGNGVWITAGITPNSIILPSNQGTIFFGEGTVGISTNNGASWSSKALWAFDPALGTAGKAVGPDTIWSLATDNKGVWVAVGAHWTASLYCVAVCSRSTDNGATWSTPTVLWGPRNCNPGNNPVARCIATNGSGTWVIGGIDYPSTSSIGVISYSTDNGATWSTPIQAPSAAVTKQLIYDQGQFLMVGNNAYMTSTDGITWSALGTLLGWTTTSPDITGLVYSGSRFVIAGKDGSGNAMIQTSS